MKKNKKITVLSLFCGISCAHVALSRLGYTDINYYASEIDKYAIQISQKNWPKITQIGDVKGCTNAKFVTKEMGKKVKFVPLDLLIGGSPCQDLSIAKNNRKGLEGDRSGLFWEYIRILKETKPKYFVLENVNSMPKDAKETITKAISEYAGKRIEPIMINAALVSAQQRKRLFWTNIPNVIQPEDKHIYLKDILLDGNTEDLKSLCITATYHKKNEQNFKRRDGQMIRIGDIGSNAQAHRVYSPDGKSVALSALGGGQGSKTGLYIVQTPRGKNKGGNHYLKSPTVTSSSFEYNNRVKISGVLRKLHPIECERLQGLPDNYTASVSNSQRYKACGNAFNADVVAHILSFMKL